MKYITYNSEKFILYFIDDNRYNFYLDNECLGDQEPDLLLEIRKEDNDCWVGLSYNKSYEGNNPEECVKLYLEKEFNEK